MYIYIYIYVYPPPTYLGIGFYFLEDPGKADQMYVLKPRLSYGCRKGCPNVRPQAKVAYKYKLSRILKNGQEKNSSQHTA